MRGGRSEWGIVKNGGCNEGISWRMGVVVGSNCIEWELLLVRVAASKICRLRESPCVVVAVFGRRYVW